MGETEVPHGEHLVSHPLTGLRGILLGTPDVVSTRRRAYFLCWMLPHGLPYYELGQRQNEGQIRTEISIVDTGIGIRPTDQTKLFHGSRLSSSPPPFWIRASRHSV